MPVSADYKRLKQLYKTYDKHFAEYWKWHKTYYLEEDAISKLKSRHPGKNADDEIEKWRISMAFHVEKYKSAKTSMDEKHIASDKSKAEMLPLLMEKMATEINVYRALEKYVDAEGNALRAVASKLTSLDETIKFHCEDDFFFEGLVYDRYIKFLGTYPKEKFKRDAAIKEFAGNEGLHTRSAKVRINNILTKQLSAMFDANNSCLDDPETIGEFASTHSLKDKEIAKLIMETKWRLYYADKIQIRPDEKDQAQLNRPVCAFDTVTEKDWDELKKLLGELSEKIDVLDGLKDNRDDASAREEEYKWDLETADTEEERLEAQERLTAASDLLNIYSASEYILKSNIQLQERLIYHVLSKCFEYGVMVAYGNKLFIDAVHCTVSAIEDACDYNFFDIADRHGIIANMLLLRYDKFLESYPQIKLTRDKAIESFAEQQGLTPRDAKARLNKAIINQIKFLFSIGMIDCLPNIAKKYSIRNQDYMKLAEKGQLILQKEQKADPLFKEAIRRIENNDLCQRS